MTITTKRFAMAWASARRCGILAVLAAGCFAILLAAPVGGAELRVMTFNIKGAGVGFDPAQSWKVLDLSDPTNPRLGPARDQRAISVIRDYGPDILSVQELKINQQADLLDAFPEFSYYGQGRRGGIVDDSNGIYFRTDRFDLLDQGDFWLSETPETPGTTFVGSGGDTNNPRMATWIKLFDHRTDLSYFVLSTHWSLDVIARRNSAALIQANLPALSGGLPILLLGDLNATKFSSEYQTLRGLSGPQAVLLNDSFEEAQGIDGRTFHNWNGGVSGTRIDHVFHDPTVFFPQEASIIRTTFDGGLYPSDHYPVTVTFSVIPEPGGFSLSVLSLIVAVVRRRRS